MNIKDLIKNNTVNFDHYQGGVFYYNVKNREEIYQFPVPQKDIEATEFPTLLAEDKAIYFMRYIRKAISNNQLVELK